MSVLWCWDTESVIPLQRRYQRQYEEHIPGTVNQAMPGTVSRGKGFTMRESLNKTFKADGLGATDKHFAPSLPLFLLGPRKNQVFRPKVCVCVLELRAGLDNEVASVTPPDAGNHRCEMEYPMGIPRATNDAHTEMYWT
jgi:hypothetical protein